MYLASGETLTHTHTHMRTQINERERGEVLLLDLHFCLICNIYDSALLATSNKEANTSNVYIYASVEVLLLNPSVSVSIDATVLLFYCSTDSRHLRLTKKPTRHQERAKWKAVLFLFGDSDGFCQGCYQRLHTCAPAGRPCPAQGRLAFRRL